MKKIILLITLVMLSCYKDDEVVHCCTPPPEALLFSIQDADGSDLLNPTTKGYFKHNNIKVFSFINGEKVLKGTPSFLTDSDYHTMRIFMSNNKLPSIPDNITGESLTLLQLSENVVDTIKTEWVSGKKHILNTKMWYNNELKWERDKTDLPILIIKKK